MDERGAVRGLFERRAGSNSWRRPENRSNIPKQSPQKILASDSLAGRVSQRRRDTGTHESWNLAARGWMTGVVGACKQARLGRHGPATRSITAYAAFVTSRDALCAFVRVGGRRREARTACVGVWATRGGGLCSRQRWRAGTCVVCPTAR